VDNLSIHQTIQNPSIKVDAKKQLEDFLTRELATTAYKKPLHEINL